MVKTLEYKFEVVGSALDNVTWHSSLFQNALYSLLYNRTNGGHHKNEEKEKKKTKKVGDN